MQAALVLDLEPADAFDLGRAFQEALVHSG